MKLPRIIVGVRFEPRDLWVGIFWRRRRYLRDDQWIWDLEVFVCLVPTLPIRFRWVRSWESKDANETKARLLAWSIQRAQKGEARALRRLIAGLVEDEPWVLDSEIAPEFVCFFCGARREWRDARYVDFHTDDCIYVAAQGSLSEKGRARKW